MIEKEMFTIVTEGKTVEELKPLALGMLFTYIMELSKRDDFFIVREPSEDRKDALKRNRVISWKIQIPHMDE